MNLTKQPPRRPSNLSIAGIVGLARMTDKARAFNNETLGEYLYGGDSGLDRKILDFLSIPDEQFAEAVEEYDDHTLDTWVIEQSTRTISEIEEFNQRELSIEPQTEEYRQRLKDRLAKYAPDRTDIKTVLQSVELDDWGNFWQLDLTKQPPRSPYNRNIAGVFGIARMAEKARAARADKIGEYKYGQDSGLDRYLLDCLNLSAESFQQGAVDNPNDLELNDWVLSNIEKDPAEIEVFNQNARQFGLETEKHRDNFAKRREMITPGQTDIGNWLDLMDYDDQKSFGIVDLARRPPRSPYDTNIGGITHLARLIDKARATSRDSLGEYWYGEDSGIDRKLLAFLGIPAQNFVDAMKSYPTDADVLNWLNTKNIKTKTEIKDHNEKIMNMAPTTKGQSIFLEKAVNKLDFRRTDIETFFDLMVLEDEKSFEHWSV